MFLFLLNHAHLWKVLYVILLLVWQVQAQDKYIVVLKKASPLGNSTTTGQYKAHNITELLGEQQSIGDFRWLQGEFTEDALSQLRDNPEIEYILPDILVHTCDIQTNPPSWGIDRIDQVEGTDKKYHYPKSAGEGVTIYLIDTGVNINHTEFDGRAAWGPTLNGDIDGSDTNGHGTFVAGVAIGRNFGVAKHANLVSIKAIGSNGSGRLSDVLRGVHWVVGEHQRKVGQKSIINLSLSAKFNQAANDVIEAAISLGIHFVVAAGNAGEDACAYSPASVKGAIVVGALDKKDQIPSFSNIGSCIKIYAPGVDIRSAWNTSNTSTYQLSGTSMATPHVSQFTHRASIV
ncbi:subtilisin-like protein [Basidiobolus meristosporus CBS 931.73]|uniref:Subtilisin-like protein n=1 Tax=Basidiobolus meristosporus CBS 931.73 TaxID=1314790 RepID=A0A1Y1ZCY2_9FUNG|nr:subtilisin-like protein [Basidiobolus meristosporus CBS 931.73]|eukprot:ORY08121.1 subtilisin-like protein [Basidiobolus meristosporus CBS 931.73]